MSTEPPHRVGAPNRDSGSIARIAFALGWICLPFGPLGVIPILTGWLAMRSLRDGRDREERSKARWAVGLGIVALLGTVLWFLLITKMRHVADFRFAQSSMRSNAHALVVYASNNDNQFPAESHWYSELIHEGFIDPRHLSDRDKDHDGDVYTYIPDRVYMSASQIILYEDVDHWEYGVIVGYADGNMDLLTHDEFQRILDEQLANTTP